jgi:transposase
MSLSQADLPHDREDLRRLASELQREIHAKTLLIEKLRARFGRSSEKLDGQVEQLELLIGEIEETEAESEARAETGQANKSAAPSSSKRGKPSGRAPLPDHLPQETIVHGASLRLPELRRRGVQQNRRGRARSARILMLQHFETQTIVNIQ